MGSWPRNLSRKAWSQALHRAAPGRVLTEASVLAATGRGLGCVTVSGQAHRLLAPDVACW